MHHSAADEFIIILIVERKERRVSGIPSALEIQCSEYEVLFKLGSINQVNKFTYMFLFKDINVVSLGRHTYKVVHHVEENKAGQRASDG